MSRRGQGARFPDPVRLLGWTLTGAALSGCGAEALLPIARFDVQPTLLCEGETREVVVNAGPSLGADTLPAELAYLWSFVPTPLAFLDGDETTRVAVIEVEVTRPLVITLTVTDDRQRSATTTQVVAITRTTLTPCSAPCADHEVCVTFDDTHVCVDDLECESDEACGGCLVCRPDDAGVGRCVGP